MGRNRRDHDENIDILYEAMGDVSDISQVVLNNFDAFLDEDYGHEYLQALGRLKGEIELFEKYLKKEMR